MSIQLIPTPPPVEWAQRSDTIFLTFNVEAEKPEVIIDRKAVTFEGNGKPDNKSYAIVIPLYEDVDPSQSSYRNKGRYLEVTLRKVKTSGPFWPSLTADKKKHHWLKIDFNRWQDEEESDDLDEMNEMNFDKLGIQDDDYPGAEDDKDDDDVSSGEDESPGLKS